MVFLNEFFEKSLFFKKSADDQNNMKNYPACKELNILTVPVLTVKDYFTVNVHKLHTFSIKILFFLAGIQKMVIRIANWEDPDQTASSV